MIDFAIKLGCAISVLVASVGALFLFIKCWQNKTFSKEDVFPSLIIVLLLVMGISGITKYLYVGQDEEGNWRAQYESSSAGPSNGLDNEDGGHGGEAEGDADLSDLEIETAARIDVMLVVDQAIEDRICDAEIIDRVASSGYFDTGHMTIDELDEMHKKYDHLLNENKPRNY